MEDILNCRLVGWPSKRTAGRETSLQQRWKRDYTIGCLWMILTRDNEYSAVLDACVLAPMPLCETLLCCAEEPALFRALWSDETLEEVSRTI
jgi:hypothetical protein